MELHYKCTIWMRVKFDEDKLDKDELLRDLKSGIHPVDMDLPDAEWDCMYDTEEQIGPEENDGQETIQLMENDPTGSWLLKPIWHNVKKDETKP